MKKSLLLMAAAAAVGTVCAQQLENPSVITDASFQGISPSGKWAVSTIYGNLSVFNLETGETYDYLGDEDAMLEYSVGNGNCINDNGVLVLTPGDADGASVWANGKFTKLHSEGAIGVVLANSITPDGSRICGSIHVSNDGYDQSTTQLPCYWEAQSDGSYGAYHLLPAPNVDFTNRAPQYITAICISEDGKTILGQILDYSGAFAEPILYTQGDDGVWSYTLPMESVFHPEDVEWPEWIEEYPAQPDPKDYMTDEMAAAYDQAMDEWMSSGYNSDLYPDLEAYMDDAAYVEYQEAYQAYKEETIEVGDKQMAFWEVYDEVTATLPCMTFNSVRLSPNAKYGYFTNAVLDDSDPMAWFPEETPYPAKLDLATGTLTNYEDGENTSLVTIYGDGDGLLVTGGDMQAAMWEGTPLDGYIEADGKLTLATDYIIAQRPEFEDWIKENMTHEVTTYDYEEGEDENGEPTYDLVEKTEEVVCCGLPQVSNDGKVVLLWTPNNWDFETEADGYYFNLRATDSVSPVKIGARESETVAYEVYDLNGRLRLKSTSSAVINSSLLAKGVYVVKALRADGTSTAKKITL